MKKHARLITFLLLIIIVDIIFIAISSYLKH